MSKLKAWKPVLYHTVIGLCLLSATAKAHLMVAQSGTLNFASGGAFLVLSVSPSAFSFVDDDADGALSVKELDKHHAQITEQTLQHVQLVSTTGEQVPLRGLLISPVHDHRDTNEPFQQITLLGRFAINTAKAPFDLSVTLLGENGKARRLNITVTCNGVSQQMTFTKTHHRHTLTPCTNT